MTLQFAQVVFCGFVWRKLPPPPKHAALSGALILVVVLQGSL